MVFFCNIIVVRVEPFKWLYYTYIRISGLLLFIKHALLLPAYIGVGMADEKRIRLVDSSFYTTVDYDIARITVFCANRIEFRSACTVSYYSIISRRRLRPNRQVTYTDLSFGKQQIRPRVGETFIKFS